MRMRRGGEEELAALADGSLAPEHRAELEARIEASPILADRLAEQERAVALLQGAGDEVEAPAGLRARVDAQRSPRKARTPRSLALGGVAVAAVAAVAVAVVLVVGSGSQGTRFEAALGPTALEPGAGGEATLTKTSSGWRIHLHATGLPRRDGDRFYEAWLRSSTGVLVPIGTFNEGANVTLWAGVSPTDYKVLTVTRERADRNEESSGQKVLAGTVRTG
ncbi:MAG TPA: anti-sigma factor [Gaiellaceae bacterium]|jgi:anti-sigma-K factor RskA